MTTTDALLAAVDAVTDQDLSGLSCEQLQEQYAVVAPLAQRLEGFGALLSAHLTARTGGRLATEDGGLRSVAGWVAEASGDSPSAAGRMLRTAELLQDGLPKVALAVLSGSVPWVRAQVLTRLVGRIDPDALWEAQDALLATARLMDPVALGVHVRHLLATWVEPVLDAEEAAASAKRHLTTRREGDGGLSGSFRLAAGDAETVLTALEPLARPTGLGDGRSAGQRRADALVEVFEQVLRHGQLPDAGGLRPQLSYVLPADWAARQDGADRCPDCLRCPQHTPPSFADLVAAGLPDPTVGPDDRRGESAVPAEHACATAAWTGPQTRARIEAVLCDARISRVLLDGLGQVRGLEALSDSVTPRQRQALVARDGGCVARGCNRPPAFCDAHHLTARADGGPTDLGNLVLLCRRHHVLWHLGKLRLRHLHAPWLTAPSDNGAPAAGPAPPSRSSLQKPAPGASGRRHDTPGRSAPGTQPLPGRPARR